MRKIKHLILENKGISVLLCIAVILQILSLIELGATYLIISDDIAYINSGVELAQNGRITMHGYLSAQAMPGMTFLIALVAIFFGSGDGLIIALKVIWLIMSLLSILGLYMCVRVFANKTISWMACIFLLASDFIWMNNVILTETPVMMIFIWVLFFSLKLAKTGKWKYFWLLITFYIVGVYFRPNIGIFPVAFFFYLLMIKYDFKLMLKQGLVAAFILVATLLPWTIRNYRIFDEFLPLGYGVGNPLLLGTYQGYGFPDDSTIDYEKEIYDSLSAEAKLYWNAEVNRDDPIAGYYSLEFDKLKANHRMSVWWKTNPGSMLYSYLIVKPKILLYGSFYWDTVFGIPHKVNLGIRLLELVLFFGSVGLIAYKQKYWKEGFLIVSSYAIQVLFYAYSFAFDRYGQTLYFFRYITIGIGISLVYDMIKEKKLL